MLEEPGRVVGEALHAMEAAPEPPRPRVALDSLAASPSARAPGLPVSTREAKDAALSPDATSVVTLRAPNPASTEEVWKVVTWDLETGEERSAVELPEDEEPTEVAFRADGARLAVTIGYVDVVVIDANEGRILGRVGSGEDTFQQAVFTPDGLLLVGGTEGAVEVWDAESFERVARTPSSNAIAKIPLCVQGGPPEGFDYCATVENRERFLSPTGRFYVQASIGQVVDGPFRLEARQAHLYEPGTLALRCRVFLDEDAELGPDSFAADDRLFAYVANLLDGPEFSVIVINTTTCQLPEGSGTADFPVMLTTRFVVVNAATMMAVLVGDSYTAELWKPQSLTSPKVGRFAVLETERTHLVGGAFSTDGDRVALFGVYGKVQTFETSRGSSLSVVQVAADGERVRRVTFLPDGRRALVALQVETGSAAALVDTDAGRILRAFR